MSRRGVESCRRCSISSCASSHTSRARFNLSREELDARFARPWASGETVRYDDRPDRPTRARSDVFEGPEIRPEEMGMGRGWANVGRTCQEVTETVLAEAERGTETRSAVETFKAMLRGAARTPITLRRGDRAGRRPSIRAGAPASAWRMAEQAVWELLHQGRLTLATASGPMRARAAGSRSCCDWATWIEAGGRSAGAARSADRQPSQRGSS